MKRGGDTEIREARKLHSKMKKKEEKVTINVDTPIDVKSSSIFLRCHRTRLK